LNDRLFGHDPGRDLEAALSSPIPDQLAISTTQNIMFYAHILDTPDVYVVIGYEPGLVAGLIEHAVQPIVRHLIQGSDDSLPFVSRDRELGEAYAVWKGKEVHLKMLALVVTPYELDLEHAIRNKLVDYKTHIFDQRQCRFFKMATYTIDFSPMERSARLTLVIPGAPAKTVHVDIVHETGKLFTIKATRATTSEMEMIASVISRHETDILSLTGPPGSIRGAV
jgi:hypothetical protein